MEGGGMRQWKMCVCGERGYEAVEDVRVCGRRVQENLIPMSPCCGFPLSQVVCVQAFKTPSHGDCPLPTLP